MFLMKPQHMSQINRIKEKIGDKYLIGMHMRSGYGDFSDTERFLVPGQEYTFIELAKNLSKEHKNVIWYFTSDSTYLDTIVQQEAAPYEVIVFETGAIEHTRSGFNIQSDVNAMTDMTILGSANELILTSRSTFSLASFFINDLSLLENFTNVNWIKKTHVPKSSFDEVKARFDKLMNIHLNFINDCFKYNKEFCKDTDFNEYETGINPNPVQPVYANSKNYTNLILYKPTVVDNCKIVIVILSDPYDYVFRTIYRRTFAKLKTIGNRTVSYMFVVGVPFVDIKGDSYPIEFLKIEMKEYNDIFVWNVTHLQETKTSRLRLTYEYLIDNYKNLEHVIQIHPNMMFNPKNLIPFMSNSMECDITGDRGFLEVEYIGGAFQLLSRKFLELAVLHVPYYTEYRYTFDVYFAKSLSRYGYKLCGFIKGDQYTRYNGNFNYYAQGKFTVLEAVPPATFWLLFNRTESLIM